jgi:hypothetical protein
MPLSHTYRTSRCALATLAESLAQEPGLIRAASFVVIAAPLSSASRRSPWRGFAVWDYLRTTDSTRARS